MQTMKLTFRILLYIGIATVLFLEYVNLVQFGNGRHAAKQTGEIPDAVVVTQTYQTLQQQETAAIDKALYHYFGIEEDQKAQQTKGLSTLSMFDRLVDRYAFFRYLFTNNNIVIPLLYVTMLLALWIQVILLALGHHYVHLGRLLLRDDRKAIIFHASEWSALSPPVLGVAGTLYALGMTFMDLGDMSSLSTVFRDNFPNAAQTTILGVSLYSVHLFLNIFISASFAYGVEEAD